MIRTGIHLCRRSRHGLLLARIRRHRIVDRHGVLPWFAVSIVSGPRRSCTETTPSRPVVAGGGTRPVASRCFDSTALSQPRSTTGVSHEVGDFVVERLHAWGV